ncbi:RBBP9/YdeN family alpha/beta hydrolase [Aureimonas populi]|uniref:RBBP9/YdeN family alpha/beta hydrolase n=1 Tax=Aureimonas populi TaxID=1701758 RepID=A0ABW5CP03_9HYPH|nr:alpha/beta hydrolase [Aureimonas populi]
MRVSDADILFVPGYTGASEQHWQSRWARKLSTARRVEQEEWSKPERETWTRAVADAVNASERPVVLVAHSLGVPTAIHAVPQFRKHVAGAFLVAPPDVASDTLRPKHFLTFGPYPRAPLPFPSVVVASRADEFSSFEAAEETAAAWGSLFIDAGTSGHLNSASGHGPWPEGLLTFGKFLSRLPLPA